MIPEIIGGFVAYAIIVLLIIFFSITFVSYFKDKHESESFPTVVSVLGLILVLSCLALVPVDIFVTASTMTRSGFRQSWANQDYVTSLVQSLSIAYYVIYFVMLLYCFLLAPFAYFYFEEQDDEIPIRGRILISLKYTCFTMVIMVIFLILGFFLKPGTPDPTNPEWYLQLFDVNGAARAVCFIFACLTIIGIIVFSVYTAYGLSALPISMIRGRKDLTRQEEETLDDLNSTRDKYRSLQAKSLGGKRMSKSEKRELEELEKKERLLARRSNLIEQNKNSWLNRCLKCVRPFQVVVGILLLIIGLIIFVSVMLTSIDRVMNSKCGASCGFVLEDPEIFNPVDFLLLYMSQVFPVDYIFMVAIFIYFLSASLSGIIRIGIKIFWIQLYRVARRGTLPQGLLLSTVILMFALLYVNVTILTIAPDYASFGYQRYCNATLPENATDCPDDESVILCKLDSPPTSNCTQTAFSTLVNRTIVITPFFGTIFMAGHFLFLLTTLFGLGWSLFRRKQTLSVQDESDED